MYTYRECSWLFQHPVTVQQRQQCSALPRRQRGFSDSVRRLCSFHQHSTHQSPHRNVQVNSNNFMIATANTTKLNKTSTRRSKYLASYRSNAQVVHSENKIPTVLTLNAHARCNDQADILLYRINCQRTHVCRNV